MKVRQLGAQEIEMVVRDIETRMDANPVRDPAPSRIRRRIVVGATALALLTLFACTRRTSPDFLGTGSPEMLGSPEPIATPRITICKGSKQTLGELPDFFKQLNKNVPAIQNCMNENPSAVQENCLLSLMGCVKRVWNNLVRPTSVDQASDPSCYPVEIKEKGTLCHANVTEGEMFNYLFNALRRS